MKNPSEAVGEKVHDRNKLNAIAFYAMACPGNPRGAIRTCVGDEYIQHNPLAGQPCLRTSTPAKKYGWGFHFNCSGKVALTAVKSPDYEKLPSSASRKQLAAMKSAGKGISKESTLTVG